jgi:Ala-tRNA(Pro) deacylase
MPDAPRVGTPMTGPSSAATPDDLFRRLDALGIAVSTVSHPAVFTVEEARGLHGRLPGAHTKNLFLKNRRDRLWLVVCLDDRRLDMKALGGLLDAGRLSFGSPERLSATLGVPPGSVTPFALVNDRECAVTPVLDDAMLRQSPLHFHPLVNTMTTAIAPAGLLAFVAATGHVPHILDLDPATVRAEDHG